MNHRSWKSDSPHEILTSRGVIFQRFLYIENKFVYPPPTKLWRYTGFTIAFCLCPSVCPSVKKWFLYNNSSSIWHTMMILHIYVDLDLKRISDDFGSKAQRSNLDFKLFYRFRTTAPFAFGIHDDTSQMYWPRPEKDLYWLWGQRIKGQCHIWSLNFVSFPHDKSIYFLAYNNDTSQMYWPWPEKGLFRFGVNRLKYKKRLLLRCIHHFKSDLIYIMDHMRISGDESSLVILSQKSDAPNVLKQAEAKRDGVINPQNYNLEQSRHFQSFGKSRSNLDFKHFTICFIVLAW